MVTAPVMAMNYPRTALAIAEIPAVTVPAPAQKLGVTARKTATHTAMGTAIAPTNRVLTPKRTAAHARPAAMESSDPAKSVTMPIQATAMVATTVLSSAVMVPSSEAKRAMMAVESMETDATRTARQPGAEMESKRVVKSVMTVTATMAMAAIPHATSNQSAEMEY